MNTKEQRQAEYLRIVEETGSQVQARRRIGVTSKTIANWRADPEFVERLQDALDIANDAIRAKVREMALAGSEPMLALSMKVIEPALRPASTNVAVGVKVDARQAELEKLPPEQIVARINRMVADARMRAAALPEPSDDAIDVEVVPAALGPGKGAHRAG